MIETVSAKSTKISLAEGMKVYHYIDIISALFVITLLTTNILSSAKIVDLQTSLFGIPLIFDAGLIIFPFCYIFGDVLTEVYGYKRSRRVIWLGFGAMLLITVLLAILRVLPGETSWLDAGGQGSYETSLFGLYSGILVVASLGAYLVGEFVNSYVLAKLKIIQEGKNMWLRFLLSTVAGQFFDTIIFVGIATIGGLFPASIFLSLFFTKYILKVLIEAVLLPVTLPTSRFLKRIEGEDYYDKNTSFNPFKF